MWRLPGPPGIPGSTGSTCSSPMPCGSAKPGTASGFRSRRSSPLRARSPATPGRGSTRPGRGPFLPASVTVAERAVSPGVAAQFSLPTVPLGPRPRPRVQCGMCMEAGRLAIPPLPGSGRICTACAASRRCPVRTRFEESSSMVRGPVPDVARRPVFACPVPGTPGSRASRSFGSSVRCRTLCRAPAIRLRGLDPMPGPNHIRYQPVPDRNAPLGAEQCGLTGASTVYQTDWVALANRSGSAPGAPCTTMALSSSSMILATT